MARSKVVVAWSSGKGSAWALHRLRADPDLEVIGLLTTLAEQSDEVVLHGVPRPLVERQAEALNLPLIAVTIPWPCPNPVYEARMGEGVWRLKALGATHIAFGDVHLRETRQWREERLAGSGLAPLFPLWGADSAALAAEMIDGGLQAILTSVDTHRVPADLAGRRYDWSLVADLPPGVDVCGEQGEFRSFVTGGPMLAAPIPVTSTGPTVDAQGFARVQLAAV